MPHVCTELMIAGEQTTAYISSMLYIYIYTYRSYVRSVGALKVANLHGSPQQCVVVEWSGRSVAVRVRAQGQGMEFFPSFFFFSV